jgi:2-methylisocitrate lyase-like PEP mutase family enzyme
VESIVERITHTINAPVTVDFEGGYGEDGKTLADNVSRLIDLGVVGINFEDRVVQGKGLYTMDRQAKRISALRNAAEKSGVPVFINARSDVFFESDDHAKSIDQALVRANAYHAAGASGFFVPGLVDRALIKQVCEGVSLPVNVMLMEGVPPNAQLAKIGVARISYGPISYIQAMNGLAAGAQKVYS